VRIQPRLHPSGTITLRVTSSGVAKLRSYEHMGDVLELHAAVLA
jgi:hypothetical protein